MKDAIGPVFAAGQTPGVNPPTGIAGVLVVLVEEAMSGP